MLIWCDRCKGYDDHEHKDPQGNFCCDDHEPPTTADDDEREEEGGHA